MTTHGSASPPSAIANPIAEAPSSLLYAVVLDVRWRDLDAFNHVNNATYLTFVEEARLQWFASIAGPWLAERSAPVMAASSFNYRLPITWPAQVRVELYCTRIGHSSLTLTHRVVDAKREECLYGDGQVVLVWTDPTIGKSIALPSAIRDAAANAAS